MEMDMVHKQYMAALNKHNNYIEGFRNKIVGITNVYVTNEKLRMQDLLLNAATKIIHAQNSQHQPNNNFAKNDWIKKYLSQENSIVRKNFQTYQTYYEIRKFKQLAEETFKRQFYQVF